MFNFFYDFLLPGFVQVIELTLTFCEYNVGWVYNVFFGGGGPKPILGTILPTFLVWVV